MVLKVANEPIYKGGKNEDAKKRNNKKSGYFQVAAREDHLDGTEVWTVECRFPEKEGYYAHRVIISIDKALNLPFRVSIYDWPGDLVEEYVFRDLAINVGLEENDFEPDNPEYNFSSLKQ